jgi:alpha-L-fucosidase 2
VNLSQLVVIRARLSFAQVARWKEHLSLLPSLPVGAAARPPKYSSQKLYPATAGAPGRSNSENTELYASHPFRIFGTGKPNLALAQQSYLERPSPCNSGWCQDNIQAAMLNLTDEAVQQLVSRAAETPANGFRFGGFAKHYQDYEPSLDHFAFMRTGLNYMLM